MTFFCSLKFWNEWSNTFFARNIEKFFLRGRQNLNLHQIVVISLHNNEIVYQD